MRNLVKRAIVGAVQPSMNSVLTAGQSAQEATCRS
jgi:hypothetical protein